MTVSLLINNACLIEPVIDLINEVQSSVLSYSRIIYAQGVLNVTANFKRGTR